MGKSKIKEIEDVHHLTTLSSDPEQRRHHVQPHALVLASAVRLATGAGLVFDVDLVPRQTLQPITKRSTSNSSKKPVLVGNSSGWQLTENRAMLSCNEGSAGAFGIPTAIVPRTAMDIVARARRWTCERLGFK
jgi:hypothetical protein